MIWPFSKKIKQELIPVKKTFAQGVNCRSVNNIDFQTMSGAVQPYFRTYIDFYSSIAPLGDAIDTISVQFASILPKVFDVKTKEFSDDHPILDLLKNPNTNETYCEFAEIEANFFNITANQYWIMTLSKLDGEPLELFAVPPQWLNPLIGMDGRVSSYNYSPEGDSTIFTRKNVGRRIKYLSRDGKQELFQLKGFNPNSAGFYVVGLSKLHSIFYELAQYRLSSIHNQSLLQNGGRPSGMLSNTKDADEFTDDQLNRMRSEFEAMWASPTNAGRPFIGSNMEWTDFTQNNHDMDFANLKIQVKEMIYNRLKIPLPLINSNALSLANMDSAMTQLFELAVLPLATKIFGALTMNVLSQYPDTDDLILTFDPSTIPSLRDRNIEQVKSLSGLNIFSDNELRNKLDSPSYDGGDEVFKPSTLIPVASVDPVSNVESDNNAAEDNTDGDPSPTTTSGNAEESETTA